MGNKGNPRRQLRSRIIAGSIGVLLLAGGASAAVYEVHKQTEVIAKQDKLIHEYQQKLVEQGSLIDQQKKDLSNQKRELTELNTRVNTLSEKLGTQKKQKLEAEETFKQQEKSLKSKIKKLEQELAFKKAHEGQAIAASTLPSRGEPSRGRTVTVEATGYIAMCSEGCSGVTATGYNLAAHPSAKVIAVDPDVIPLGTKVYVPGYGYAVAADTGGGINGHEIDIHFPTTRDARDWGRRTIQIKILN